MTTITSAELMAGEREANRDCQRSHRDHWVVTVREGNFSAFNGGHFTPSDYSALRCNICGRCWRSKAGYVRHLPDARQDQEEGQ